jgi:hypothetical protein
VGRSLPPRQGPPPGPPAVPEVSAETTGVPSAAGSVVPTAVSVVGAVVIPRTSAGYRAGSAPVLMRLRCRKKSLVAIPVSSILAAFLVSVAGGASVGLAVGPWELRVISAMRSGSGSGVLASFPFPVLRLVPRVGHLLDEVQCHLGIDVAGRMDGVQGPPCPEGLLHLVPATPGTAGQLNAIQHDSWLQLLFEQKFQLRQIRDECRQEFWVTRAVCERVKAPGVHKEKGPREF